MQITVFLIIGPELFWLMLYAAATRLDLVNRRRNGALDDFIEKLWFWIPAFSLLVFGLWSLPQVEKSGLLLRVWICGIIGGHLTLTRALGAYSKQGPGIGMGYLVGLMLELFVLAAGSVWVVFWG